ncbi:MAG: TolC family protein [bacterium]
MKHLQRFLIVLPMISVALQASLCQETTLTLQETITTALQASEELRIAEQNVRQAELQAREIGARRLPKLDFSAQYLFTSEVMKMIQPATELDLGFASATIPGRELAFGDEHNTDFSLKFTQPIFTGFGLQKAHRSAEWEVVRRQKEADQICWEVQCRAEETYRQAQKAVALVQIAELQVRTMERHLGRARELVAQGVALAEIAARAELAHVRAKASLLEAQQAEHLTKTALQELLDKPADSAAWILEPLTDSLTYTDVSVEDTVQIATKRCELDVINLQREVVQEQVGVQKAGFYPSLSAFAALNYGKPGIDRFENDWMFYQTAGVSLNWTVWDWHQRSYRMQQVQVSHRQLDDAYCAAESKIRLEVERAESQLKDAFARIRVADKSVELAQEILQWVEQRYQQGAASENELLDALDDLHRSKVQRIIALSDLFLARLELKRTRGYDQ